MLEPTDLQIDAALERGRDIRHHEPLASSVRYDRRSGRVIVNLTSGCVFAFPAKLIQGLENATAQQLAEVERLGAGSGLHWETLDVDVSIQGLLAGSFGTQANAAQQIQGPGVETPAGSRGRALGLA